MNNPEFKRNLWLSFSPHRLMAMPALLGLTFLAAALADRQQETASSLYAAAITLFILLVWLWGSLNASASIVDELRDKTWDQQRMSSLDPWTMTWGKLLGATSFNWYGGLMCLVVIGASGITAAKPDVFSTLLSLCAAGVMLHAIVIALNLHTSQLEARLVHRGGIGWLAIVLMFMIVPLIISPDRIKAVSWWGMEPDRASFLLGSSLLFAACAVFAAWRTTCNALQVRTLPWAWPALACILTLYFSGFVKGSDRLQPLIVSGLFISGFMSYAALFSEPASILKWRKLRLLQIQQNWRGWLEHLPLWPTTLLLAFIFAAMMEVTSGGNTATRHNTFMTENAIAFVMMLLRDTCVLLFFSFSTHTRRAVGSTLLYLLVLNLLLPFLANIAGLDTLRRILMPLWAHPGQETGAAFIMMLHAGIAMVLVGWRLRSFPQVAQS